MTSEKSKKCILVAPLNWGLGHATRCIPIINALIDFGYTPILASDGSALDLLRKEFPQLLALDLPSYHIEYAKKGENFKWKLIKNSPKTINAILAEKKIIKEWVKEYNLAGIISDNRLGAYSKKIPSVILTHQLNVLSGKTTWISSILHQYFIRKFKECWVPDAKDFPNLSGKLGHLEDSNLNIKYIGVLSRFKKQMLPVAYELMVVLSGPEPQRTLLEEKLSKELKAFKGSVVFVKGKIESEQTIVQQNHITFYNFMQKEQLEKTFNESDMVICRSGYTTVMDLVCLEKKALFIPTPGQFEQEYLAKKYKKEGFLPSVKQDKFRIDDLLALAFYKGLPKLNSQPKWEELFAFFESE